MGQVEGYEWHIIALVHKDEEYVFYTVLKLYLTIIEEIKTLTELLWNKQK